ncbi:MAG: mechanosensitive ion channel family protein [Elusimicrobiota bacterium]
MNTDIIRVMTGPFFDVESRLAAKIPEIIAAFLLILVGLFAARALRMAVEGLLSRIDFDKYTSRVGINEVLARMGFGKSPIYVFGFLVYWFVFFVFFVSAANAVNITAISGLLERFALFLPSLVAAILIVFGGLLFARFLADVVSNAAAANNVSGGAVLAKACYIVVVIFAAMTALDQLGIRIELVSAALEILLASAGLAAALAFGLGGKDAAADIIRDWAKNRDRR